ADLDLDGTPEILVGARAYRADGTIYWEPPATLFSGDTAIGNFDGDLYPEIVVTFRGALYLLEHDGRVKWGPIPIPGSTGAPDNPPTIADLDGDGRPEIAVAGGNQFTVFETDGSIKWSSPIQNLDVHANFTGSSVFDFEDNGQADIVY